MDEINQKIESLRKEYPEAEDQQMLSDWEKSAKISAVTVNLQENDAIKLILAQYQKELFQLDKILLTDESLFKSQEGMMLGQLIHAQRKWYKKFLNIFTVAKADLNNKSKMLDSFNN